MHTTYKFDWREFDVILDDLDKAGFPEHTPDGFRDRAAQPLTADAHSMMRSYKPP